MSIAAKLAKLKTIKQDIKSALEEKGQTPSNVFSTYANNIRAIETGGITPSGELAITENGTYDVTNYASANVNVAIVSESSLKKLLDATKTTYQLFANYTGSNIDGLISYSDTSNVTNMGYMFYNCTNLQTIPQLDTSNATNMGYMFDRCTNLQTIPQLDTSNVTNMTYMFDSCYKLSTLPQLNTINATNLSYMFFRCYLLQIIDLTHMKTMSTSYSNSTFSDCRSLTKLVIRNIDTIPVINSNTFTGCYHFTGTTNSIYNPDGLKDGRIYVPDDRVEELKVATNWSKYADIIVPLSELGE